MISRRSLLAAAAAAPLARPAIGATAKTLVFVPQANLTSLDPVWTTATVTRNFALMTYETLYGRNQAFEPQPQMVEGHTVDDDGKRWTMKLRDGLLWHDGTKVLNYFQWENEAAFKAFRADAATQEKVMAVIGPYGPHPRTYDIAFSVRANDTTA